MRRMENQSAAGFGPVLFIGLTLAALVTHTPPNPDLPNPIEQEPLADTAPLAAAAFPVLDLPEMAALTPINSAPVSPGLELDRREVTFAVPVAPQTLIVTSYPDLPDRFSGYAPIQTSLPEKLAGLWVQPNRAAAHGGLASLQQEAGANVDPESAPVTALHALQGLLVASVSNLNAMNYKRSWQPWQPTPGGPSLDDPEADIFPTSSRANWATVTGNFVNLREAPMIDAPRLAQYFRNDRLLISRVTQDGWARVSDLSNPPITGWMSIDFLAPETP
ncbi:MAG: SH3 domain-containing protein [Pseudomonadota bacterium]